MHLTQQKVRIYFSITNFVSDVILLFRDKFLRVAEDFTGAHLSANILAFFFNVAESIIELSESKGNVEFGHRVTVRYNCVQEVTGVLG